jgi:hypothetical protein
VTPPHRQQSSRSHAILQLSVEVETSVAGADGTASEVTIRRAKLNLVDLAGSEKWNTKSDIQVHFSDDFNAPSTSI